MRRFSAIILLMFCTIVCIAQDKMHTKNNKAGIYDNIYELYQQISKHRSDSTCIKLAENMRKLAIQQGDKRAYAMSFANPLSYYMSKHKDAEFYDTLDKLLKSSEEAKLWSFYYYGITQQSIYLLRNRKLGEALQLGENTMQKAYAENNRNGIYVSQTIMLNCYLILHLYNKAEAEVQKAIKAEIGLPDNKLLFGTLIYFQIRRSNIKLKKANLKLAKQNQELENDLHTINAANQASDAKTTFLFNMSHDIRTPMNAIIGFANLLMKQKDDPEMVEMYTDKIKNSGDYLLSLNNNALEAGMNGHIAKPIDVVELVNTLSGILKQNSANT